MMNREEGSPPPLFPPLFIHFSPPLLRGVHASVSCTPTGEKIQKAIVRPLANQKTSPPRKSARKPSSFRSAHLESEFWPQQFLSSMSIILSLTFETIYNWLISSPPFRGFRIWRESKLKWRPGMEV